jgi:TRAP transporter TAXI family solute receptor
MSDGPSTGKRLLARWLERRALAVGSELVALREFFLVAAVALAIIVAAFWIAFRFVRPAPPDEFAISTGAEGGAYQLYARRYAELLAREGVRVQVRASTGSLENLERLADPESGVSVAFVQGGVGDPARQPELVTLAALYYEPLWVFYRGESEVTLPGQLSGRRVAVGPEGSGTRALVLTLLDASRPGGNRERLLPLAGAAAAEALLAGRIDAAAFVAGADAPYVQRLLRAKGVRLMSFALAEAFSRRFPYLAAVSLPRGVIDIAEDIPSRNVTLVATTAYLVARQDFHPALVSVLLEAVNRVHHGGSVFHRIGDFPAGREGDFPLSEDAQRYFKSGPPLLQRYLPFWVANLIQRLLILLVPLVAVAIPVMRLFPSLYVWRVRARVFRWYRELRSVEAEAARKPGPERVRELLSRLDAIEEGVGRTRVPLAYSDYAYNLKLHVDLIRTRLQRMTDERGERASS